MRFQRTAAIATAAGCVVGASAVAAPAAFAAAPTPTSMGLSSPSEFVQIPVADDDCIIGASCQSAFWVRPGAAQLIQSSGYVKGKDTAKQRAVDISTQVLSSYSVAPIGTRTVVQTYKYKKHQYRLKMTVSTLYEAAVGGDPATYGEVAVAQNLARKKGTSGPWKKKVGIGLMVVVQVGEPLPAAIGDNNYAFLGKQMRKTIRAGADYYLTGPVGGGA